MSAIKGPAPEHHDGRALRIGIVHARWNETIIDPLVRGARAKLLACGVAADNIVVQSCPGSWELPLAVQRLHAASQVQAATAGGSAGDLLGASSSDLRSLAPAGPRAFDAIIAVGVLIKGHTMHFEYIADAVSHGLMRVQLDTGVPVVFGVLTVLSDEQAQERAGIAGPGGDQGHNHGEDWGLAAVEMGVKRGEWAAGKVE